MYAFGVQKSGSSGSASFYGAIGRLKPGVFAQPASSEIATIADRASTLYPSSNANVAPTTWRVHSGKSRWTGPHRHAAFLQGARVLVLLIACANLAGLQLGRLDHLRRDLALRSALGASRARLLSSLVMEGMVCSALAGALGLLLGLWSVGAATALAPPNLAQHANVTLDAALIGYLVSPRLQPNPRGHPASVPRHACRRRRSAFAAARIGWRAQEA